jgi:hypothetical protein
MSGPNYAPPLGTATPGPAANVAETVPAPATFNTADGESSTQVYLSSTLEPEEGQPSVNAPISISNLPASALQTFKWE